MSVDPETQRRRLTQREGAEGLVAFEKRWIPLEERYFTAFDVESRCDYALEMAEPPFVKSCADH